MNVMKYGARFLIISSSLHDEAGSMYIENEAGESQQLTKNDLQEMSNEIRNHSTVEVVFININNGEAIAEAMK